jgi:cytochrome c oxidase subunit 2
MRLRIVLSGFAPLVLLACGTAASDNARVVPISARQWAFTPNVITLQQGVPVDLELTSADVHHGFNLPDFAIRADVIPDQTTHVRFTPDKAGTFLFHCDYYCGAGHEGMNGQIIVQ